MLPIFREQAKQGKIVITHPDMVRFFMTIPQAVQLAFTATVLAKGGEIFVLRMHAMRIKDLAEVCATRFSEKPVAITYGTVRPGEKIGESLMTPDEARSAVETDSLFIIIPQIEVGDIRFDHYRYPGSHPLTSNAFHTATARPLTHSEIHTMLDETLAVTS